jgi:hypothetical protein
MLQISKTPEGWGPGMPEGVQLQRRWAGKGEHRQLMPVLDQGCLCLKLAHSTLYWWFSPKNSISLRNNPATLLL